MAVLSVTTISSAWPAPRCLLTVLPDLHYQLIQLFDHCNGLIDAGQKFFQILALEFLALGIAPILLGLLPLQPKLFGNRPQARAIRVHDFTSSPLPAVLTSAAAGVPAGAGIAA